jgi:hypothetical protein
MAGRALILVATALALLALPSAALARGRDRNHDRIPDRWERHFGIALTKKAGAADPDHDGLSNAGEFASHTNPKVADSNHDGVSDANEDPDRDRVDNGNEVRERTNPLKPDTNNNHRKDGLEDADRDGLDNADEDASGNDPIDSDTDGDGTRDGEENGGWIASFDGTTLTVKLFKGDAISGAVDDSTDIECGSGDDFLSADDSVDRVVAAQDDPAGDDPSSDDSADPMDVPTSDDTSDDGSAGDPAGGVTTCTTADLKPGAVVHEADVSVTGAGAAFSLIDLVDSSTD